MPGANILRRQFICRVRQTQKKFVVQLFNPARPWYMALMVIFRTRHSRQIICSYPTSNPLSKLECVINVQEQLDMQQGQLKLYSKHDNSSSRSCTNIITAALQQSRQGTIKSNSLLCVPLLDHMIEVRKLVSSLSCSEIKCNDSMTDCVSWVA